MPKINGLFRAALGRSAFCIICVLLLQMACDAKAHELFSVRSLSDYKTVCIVTFYEGSVRAPLSAKIPSMKDSQKSPSLVGSTPKGHVALLVFDKNGKWAVEDVNAQQLDLSSIEDNIELDSEHMFSGVPNGFEFCSNDAKREIACAALRVERGIRLCAPLFVFVKN